MTRKTASIFFDVVLDDDALLAVAATLIADDLSEPAESSFYPDPRLANHRYLRETTEELLTGVDCDHFTCWIQPIDPRSEQPGQRALEQLEWAIWGRLLLHGERLAPVKAISASAHVGQRGESRRVPSQLPSTEALWLAHQRVIQGAETLDLEVQPQVVVDQVPWGAPSTTRGLVLARYLAA
jgi:hypothetical protein